MILFPVILKDSVLQQGRVKMLKAISYFLHRTNDALPKPVTSALNATTLSDVSAAINAAKLLNDGYNWCRGGGAAARELKEEAALRNEMELHPERLRSASPK